LHVLLLLVAGLPDADDADEIDDEPVYRGDEIVDRVTTGGFGHTMGKSLAMADVKTQPSGTRE